ncbi:MAG: transcriptional repressor [Eubacteriales bacterium]|nr:transcriptional repressor [Eubacteriales bacterium]
MPERGRYQTRQKEAITDYFKERPEECLTADELYAALESDVGMTTVYRAISRLCEEGVLRKYAPQNAGEAALYQLNPCRESHLHIRCVECGKLAHLHCDEVREFGTHLRSHHGFELDEKQTILYGLCEECARRRDENQEEKK